MKKQCGFAVMSHDKVVAIASAGGKAAHALGRTHKWATGSAEAKEAGRKGGQAPRASREKKEGYNDPRDPMNNTYTVPGEES